MFTHPRRHIQVVSTARRLLSLKLAPEVCQHLYGVLHRDHQTGALQLTGSEVAGALPADLQTGRSQTRGHLLLLFSAVCRCISSNNPMLRDSLRQVCYPLSSDRSFSLSPSASCSLVHLRPLSCVVGCFNVRRAPLCLFPESALCGCCEPSKPPYRPAVSAADTRSHRT